MNYAKQIIARNQRLILNPPRLFLRKLDFLVSLVRQTRTAWINFKFSANDNGSAHSKSPFNSISHYPFEIGTKNPFYASSLANIILFVFIIVLRIPKGHIKLKTTLIKMEFFSTHSRSGRQRRFEWIFYQLLFFTL